MDYSRIPEELKKLNQWVCTWDNSKVPMKAFEKKAASSTAPETWGTFEQAAAAVEGGKYDQVGFVFADTGLVGIDIDVGFEDGLMTPLCADIMKACHSYTEKSRSGRGVHILLHGDLPFPGKNNLKGVEIYKSRRFFIMTGKQLIFPEIIENQEAIDYVVEKYFPVTEKTGSKSPMVQKIYVPIFRKPEGGKVFVRPDYPEIISGGRNLSLTSLAGALHNYGWSKQQIYRELCYVNQNCCKPPLHDRELQSICESVTRYRR
ncbi:MAG: primase C-terminal domain-containing protein [Oscillospiraceae bacterium]|nr:primase C-terminal domain-containing protein [Oscillospiraceae bacterium]